MMNCIFSKAVLSFSKELTFIVFIHNPDGEKEWNINM